MALLRQVTTSSVAARAATLDAITAPTNNSLFIEFLLCLALSATGRLLCHMRRLTLNCAVTGRFRSREIRGQPTDQARCSFDHFTNNLTSGPNVVNEAHSLSSE